MIKSKRLIIKALEKKHLENLRMLRNDPETNYYLTSIMPINEYEQEQWFKKLSLDSSKIYFIIEDLEGKFIGVVRCDEWDKINRSIRIGIDIVKESRRQGYATEAYTKLFEFLFGSLGLNRIWLLVTDYNKTAGSLYKKLGFKPEGKLREAIYRKGKYHDYIVMGLLKKEYDKN